jgi:hypothetical protein
MAHHDASAQRRTCSILFHDEATGRVADVALPAPMTLEQFRRLDPSLADVSAVMECDAATGAPLKRALIMEQAGDTLQPGHCYIARRDAAAASRGAAPSVTFSSAATVREYSLSFVAQSPSASTSVTAGFEGAPTAASAPMGGSALQFPLRFEHGGAEQRVTAAELRAIVSEDYAACAKQLSSELDALLAAAPPRLMSIA